MPANIRIIHAHDFIKVTPEGKIDLEESKKLLIEIALVVPLVDYYIVLDTREMQSEMSVTDLWYLAAELSSAFRKSFSRPRKTAILCPLERFNFAEFFALCAKNVGFQVSAFTSFEKAYEWLIAN